MSALVLLAVIAALWIAFHGKGRLKDQIGSKQIIWIGGIAAAVVVLSALLVYGLTLTNHLSDDPTRNVMRVRITGEMWWWRVADVAREGRTVMLDANELHILVGEHVTLELESADVSHSCWIHWISGKLDIIPG